MVKDFGILEVAAQPWEAEWVWVTPVELITCAWVLETGRVCVSVCPRGRMTAIVLPFSCSAVLGQSNGSSAHLN